MGRKHPCRRSLVSVWTITLLLGTACGSDRGSPAGSSPSEMGGMDHGSDSVGDQGYAFGQPADPDEADRTVRVVQTDMLQFAPSEVSVNAGDTVRFVIMNLGLVPHEFVLGDERYQERHAREMSEMGEMPDEANAVALEPSESAEIVWTFTEQGTVLYGCHLAGHYEAGMVGEITVEA